MRWTRLEQAITAKLIRYPLSTTPRERVLILLTVRVLLLGIFSCVAGLLLLSVGPVVAWDPLIKTGVVLFTAGLTLLLLSIALDTCLIIVYGD